MLSFYRPFIAPAVALLTCVAAQGQLTLPGKTLGGALGLEQPAKNAKNILKNHISPPCPHLDKTLRDLLDYARINHPALYRQAIKLRRTGFTQGATRNWLENAICTTEGF